MTSEDEIESLIEASFNNKVEKVRELLSKKHIRENAHIKNNKALCSAAEGGHSSILSMLLEVKSVKDHSAINENFPLLLAVQNNHYLCMKILLKEPAVQSALPNTCQSILLQGAMEGNVQIIQDLLHETNVSDNVKFPQFYILIADSVSGNREEVNKILESNKTILQDGEGEGYDNIPVRLAAVNGHLSVCERFLKEKIVVEQIAENDNEILNLACLNNKLSIVEILLKENQVVNNINIKNHRALRSSISSRGYQITYKILQVYKELGLAYPENVKVPGYDNLDTFFSRYKENITKQSDSFANNSAPILNQYNSQENTMQLNSTTNVNVGISLSINNDASSSRISPRI